MELLGTIALALALVLILALLVVAWYQHTREGGFWNFWMAWNIMDLAGHVAALLLTVLASMFKSDS